MVEKFAKFRNFLLLFLICRLSVWDGLGFYNLELFGQVIDFVDGPDSSVGDSFTDVIVKFNAGHQYLNTTGI